MKLFNSLSKFSRAFTLIELLIVIVIISILASALIPRLKGIQAKARDTARIADMRQMQNALAMYYADNGSYPGSTHYNSVISTGCTHITTTNAIWTNVFNASFQANYLSSLPTDPRGADPKYCYGYSNLPSTATYCTKKDGTIIDVDGVDASGNITGPQGEYVLTFAAETDLRDAYPRWHNYPNRFCVFPTNK